MTHEGKKKKRQTVFGILITMAYGKFIQKNRNIKEKLCCFISFYGVFNIKQEGKEYSLLCFKLQMKI